MGDVVPMKQRDGETVLPALKQSFKKNGFPMSIHSDDDGAFQTVVSKFCKDKAINHIITRTHANVVERFIRTLKTMIHDRGRFNKAGWTSMFPVVLKKYNSTKHSSTILTPNEAHDEKNHMEEKANLM